MAEMNKGNRALWCGYHLNGEALMRFSFTIERHSVPLAQLLCYEHVGPGEWHFHIHLWTLMLTDEARVRARYWDSKRWNFNENSVNASEGSSGPSTASES